MNEPPIVFVVDDDPAIRRAVANLLQSVGVQTRLFESPEDLLASARQDLPGCIVMDIMFPGRSGLEAQREVTEKTRLPIIFVTGHGDLPMAVRAMKDGAVHFLSKPFRDQALLDAVDLALAKDRDRRAADQRLSALRARFESLTPREREVMEFVVTGSPNREIAVKLGMSEMTVKIHRTRVMRKMQVATLVDLVRLSDQLHSSTRSVSRDALQT